MKCGLNEQPGCGSCDETCSGFKVFSNCSNYCSDHRCSCQDGFVRDNDFNCVLKENCPTNSTRIDIIASKGK